MSTQPEPTHTVVRNDEEQFSLWPVGRPVPAGWQETGFRGTADECAAHVDEVWTDMRPRSLREATDQPATGRATGEATG